MFIQFLVTYFKMRYEVMKLRYEHKRQRNQLKKALNQTARSINKKTTKYYNPYFNIGKMIEYNEDNPMSYEKETKRKIRKNGKK